jgi:transcription elongation factor Elf1
MSTDEMRCEKCGETMNHHADKLLEPADAAEAAAVDPELGGFLEQTHTCPSCGNVQSRRVSPR